MLNDSLTFPLLAEDPHGGEPWHLFCAEYTDSEGRAQSVYFYAMGFTDAQQRLKALCSCSGALTQLHGASPGPLQGAVPGGVQ
jgi:hypothetical protein